MEPVRIAFLGDIYASPGRMVLQQQLPVLRAEHRPDLVIANAENARSGSGLSPKIYRRLREMEIHAVTLGDHVFKDQSIVEVLNAPDEPIARPANISARAAGRDHIRLALPGHPGRSVFVITVLGRIFINMPADDPFACVDRLLQRLPEPKPIVIVEAHMEATSEKTALAYHLDGRVTAVLGTHTHVPTADARLLPKGTAFVTDVGMCGPFNSIIGANPEAVVQAMTTNMHVPFGIGSGDERLCGVILTIDPATGRASSINRVEYHADRRAAPFDGSSP